MKWTNKGHELDFIGKRFKDRKQIYIYGTGPRGKLCYERLAFLNCTIGFIDGNTKKRKIGFMGLPVFGIEQIDALKKEHSLIIIAAGPTSEGMIAKTLLFYGFIPESDFYYMDSFINAYLQIYAMYAHNKLMVNLYPQSVTERCSLKCVHCNHSLPYLKNPVNFKKEEFIADLDLFFSHVDYIYSADFVGGEPFVHPDFYGMMKYAAEHYRSRMFRMLFVTNGTIVPSDEILELMKEYNIQFWFSDYRTNVPQIQHSVEAFLQRVEKSGVTILRNELETWSDYALGNADIKFANEEEKIRYFDYCGTPCRYMRNGRLYYCTSDRMAQRAGLVEEDCDSYLDLKTITPDRRMEILEFDLGFNTKGYLNTCTKCNGPYLFSVTPVPKGVQCTQKQLQDFPKQCPFPGIEV